MKKPILITLLCAGLMLVTPLVGVAQENKISDNIKEQQVDFEGLVVQIRNVVNKILLKYGHIPMVRSLCNLILEILGWIGLWALCNFFFVITVLIGDLLSFPLVFLGFEYAALNVGAIIFIIILELDRNCPTIWDLIPPPIKSIYTLSETKDITNLAKGSPCLQE